MHINDIDLNLLRLFDTVYRTRNVSRAAEMLGLTQPAASQGLRRLRALLADPLFMRTGTGVLPTPRADRLASGVRTALGVLESSLNEGETFDPAVSGRVFRMHLSDIGEGRFLPELMAWLHEHAPRVRLQTFPLPRDTIADALDQGRIDVALGFLPMVKDTQSLQLLRDRYIVLLRKGHPFLRRKLTGKALLAALQDLEFVGTRSHADTLRILQVTGLQERLRLVNEHFLVLPSIVRATNLAAVMPRNIALNFSQTCAMVEPDFPLRDFTVSLYWSRRFEPDPGLAWLRQVIATLFREDGRRPGVRHPHSVQRQ